MTIRVWLSLAAFLVAASGGAAAAQQQSPAELAAALQKKYAGVRDFSADFVQTYRGGVLKRQLKDTGRVMVRKPGKMRWEYQTPEEKLFVSDGASIYWYVPQDKHVEIRPVPADDEASTPALFLAGKGDITRDFTPSIVERPAGQAEGTQALKLVPRTPQAEYRLAYHRRRPVDPVPARPGDRRFAGGNVELHLREPEGKPRVGR